MPHAHDLLSEGSGQRYRCAEQSVKEDRPLDGVVQRMLRREADPGQHLLAMASGGPGLSTGHSLCHCGGALGPSSQAASSIASAMSMATSVSARR